VGTLRRIRLALSALGLVLLAGTVGYVILGFGWLDALYQTVTTVTTVGFREVRTLSVAGKVFTIVLILLGVGTALYTLSVLLEALIEGHLHRHLERRRMDRDIGRMTGHVIICGWGRVGRACAQYLVATEQPFVVVDRDQGRLDGLPYPLVVGDVTDDDVLIEAGIVKARALIAALNTDADNVYVTLSSRALRPDLVIIARARTETSKSKLVRAGANRAVNPQLIGGRRMAAFALQPHVAEFLDVVMHDESLEFRMEEVAVAHGSSVCGQTLREAALAERTGVLLLALRPGAAAPFAANPSPDTCLDHNSILIAVGTPGQLTALHDACGTPRCIDDLG
jgi:voltage-gated potassium channel